MKARSRAFVIHRLASCPTKDALRRYWSECLSAEAKVDPEIIAFAKQLAEEMDE